MKFTADDFLAVQKSITGLDLANDDADGTAVDTRGYSELLVILATGIVGGSSPTNDVTIAEGDTAGGSFASITSAAFAQYTATGDDTVYHGRINLAGRKRYLRAESTITGSSPTGEYSVTFVLIRNSGALPVTAAQNTNASSFSV